MHHSWFTILLYPTKISFKMYSHIKLHCMIARVEHALFLIADDTRQRFIFYMIFVSSGGVYIHTAGNIRQI